MSESKSKSSYFFPEEEKLYYKGVGKTNITDWETNFIIRQKAKHGTDADIFITLEYPENAKKPWESPAANEKPDSKDAAAVALYQTMKKEYIAEYKRAQNVLAQQAAETKLSMSKSSIDHMDKFHKKEFRDFILTNDPIAIYKLAKQTHTFIGKDSGYDDQDEVRTEFCNFSMTEDELNGKLEVNFNRMVDLVRKCETVGILKEIDGKRQCHQQLKAVVAYKPKSAINDRVVNTLARVNSPSFPKVLPDLQKKLLELDDAVERLTFREKPRSNKFVVNKTRVGDGKRTVTTEESVALSDGTRLERDQEGRLVVLQAGKPKYILPRGGGKKRVMDPRPGPAKRPRGNRNPNSRKYAQRKAAETGQSEDEVLRETICDNCGGSYHIAADCRKNKSSNKENRAPPSAARPAHKNKSYMTERVIPEEIFEASADELEIEEEDEEDDDRTINPRRLKGFFD